MTKLKQKSNVLLLRMLFLLAMVLTGSSASWGQTQIAQFKRTTEYTAASDDRYYLAENNGVTFYALGLKNNGAWNWVDNDVISQKNINGVQFVFLPLDMGEGDTGSFIKMQFASGVVKVGDILSVDCADAFTTGTDAEIGYRVGGSNTDVKRTVQNQNVNTLTHTITTSEIITDGENQYIRIGKLPYKNTYIGTITITRPKTHPADITCQKRTVDLPKLVAEGSGATYNGETRQLIISSYSEYNNGLMLNFATPQDFSNLKKVTINGAKFENIPFTDHNGKDHYRGEYATGDGKTVLELNNKDNQDFKNIIKIFFRKIQEGTYTISSIEFEFDHKPATPQLINGTTANMTIVAGKPLKLSANNVDNTFWREYDAINGTQILPESTPKAGHIPSSEYSKPVREITGLTPGTYYFAAERLRGCEFNNTHFADKTWVTVTVEAAGTLPSGIDADNAMIKQPIYNVYHHDQAKEYIAIANLTSKPDNNSVTGWGVTSVSGTSSKKSTESGSNSTLGYILGGSRTYNVDSEKGLCISQYGKAGVEENDVVLPARGTLAFVAAGTMDFYILAKNLVPKSGNGGTSYSEADRRHIKVWYKNNQSPQLKQILCANNNTNNDFNFYGERKEDNSGDGNALSFGVRLQHLGSDGTCQVFITYESEEADDKVWIKGILVKRPDLSVTIGRTDYERYEGKTASGAHHKNSTITPFGENKPYQWDFNTSGFYALNDPSAGTAASNEAKKVNQHDGRTYICGVHNGVQLMDHLLVYSDGSGDTKANFDGRQQTNGHDRFYPDDQNDWNEHIEFLHPTKYSGKNTRNEDQTGFDKDRRSYFPILSNGLKVNVTGSGWFTVACAAPNGAVKMKVLSSTNGGSAYMNVLREFVVPGPEEGDTDPDTDWKTYKVYLKAHQEKDGDDGFWHGAVKPQTDDAGNSITPLHPEDTQMSLYVVFEAIGDESGYTDNSAQLNIHYLQWINEMPGDYVFQQEEDPKLLNTLQSVVSNGTDEKPGLYWQAGNDNMWESTDNNAVIPTVNTTTKSYPSAYNSGSYTETKDGQDSGNATISQQLGIKWDVAANALTESHTEKAAEGEAYKYDPDTQYALPTDATNEFDIPISGSFFRFMPMKNQYVSTWILPTDGAKIFVLDETGQPIPFINGGDMQSVNKSRIDAVSNARERGWVAYAQGLTAPTGDEKYFTAGTSTAVRIDFAALAGKEYFIVSKDGRISLARLKATNNAYRANMEEVAQALTLVNDASGTTNTTAISNAMSGTGRYLSESKPVTLNRTFKEGQWASLVLPFSMNEEKFKEVFGKDAICLHFTDVDLTTNTVNLTHHFYNMIVAGRPVLVRPSSDGSIVNGNKTISDVTLQASAVIPNVNGRFTFTGSYDNGAMPANSLFISENAVKHYYVDGSDRKSTKALRAWFECPDLQEHPSAGAPRAARFVNYDGTLMDEDMATGIETALAESGMDATVINASTVIYNLQGNKVATGAEMQNLPAGVYVVKGKKFIVK